MKGPNWNRIIRSPCPASSLNEALLRVIKDRVSKWTIVVKTGDKPWFDDRCVLAHGTKPRAYRVWSRSRFQADWEEYTVARRRVQLVYGHAERAFTEQNKSLLTNAPNLPKWLSTVTTTAAFGARSSVPPLVNRGGKLVWSAEERVSLFSVHFDAKQCRDSFQELVTLLRYCALLPSGVA